MSEGWHSVLAVGVVRTQKSGASSVWDCFNINFQLKSDMLLCVQVSWIHPLMCYDLIVSVNQEWTCTNKIKKNPPRTKYCVPVSARIVYCGPCRDLLCKLAWDKTFRFTKQQKGSYIPTHPRVKRMVTKAFTILTSALAVWLNDIDIRA